MPLLPTTTRGRAVLAVVSLAAVAGAIAWRYQSEIIGVAAERYLTRVAASDERQGGTGGRQELLAQIHRRLLMPPPAAGTVPELFDLAILLSSRVATGEISLNWAAYLYTGYTRDMSRERPAGTPRRARAEIREILDRQVGFFAIQKRPDVPGIRVGDLLGEGEDTISLEEIEAAEREGRELDLR